MVSPPDPLVPIDDFRRAVAEALEESRRSLAPFSVLLIRIADGDGLQARNTGPLARDIADRVLGSFRARRAPAYPERELDLLAWWRGDFVVLCRNTGSRLAEIPAQRVLSRIEQEVSGPEGALQARVIVWTWSWKTANQSEFGILEQLLAEADAPREGVAHVPEPRTDLEKKLADALEQLRPVRKTQALQDPPEPSAGG